MKLNSKSQEKAQKITTVVPSIVLEEMNIYGDVLSEGAIEVDGKLFGNVRCLSLSVGENAIINGNVTAERVEINGEVIGDIVAKKIICGSNAKVRGNILHQTIHIENGAYIDGNCRKYIAPAQDASAVAAEPKLAQVSQEQSEVAEIFQPEFELVER